MKRATSDSPLTRGLLLGALFGFVLLFLVFPVFVVLYEALRLGLAAYGSALSAPHSVTAIRLTLLVALAVVPLNTVFGVARRGPSPISSFAARRC